MRTRTLHSVIAIAAMFMLAPPHALAQNLVRGKVMDYKDQPVEGAVVQFEGIDFFTKRETKTDKKGEYVFQGLQSGDYKVTASKAGVGTYTKRYTVSVVSVKERVDFILQIDKATWDAINKAEMAANAPPPPEEVASLNTDVGIRGKELLALQAIAQAAVDAQKAGKYDEAVTHFTELIAKVPKPCSDCYMQLGAAYYELKKYDEAEAAYKKALGVRPSVEAYTSLARIYNNQKKFDLAAEATRKASEVASKENEPDPAAAAGTPAPSGAAAGTKKPVASGGSSGTLYNQGVVLWNSGKYAEAKAQFEAALKADPNNIDALYQLGMANLNLGQIPAARTSFERYLKVAPNGPKAAELKTYLAQLPK